MSDTLLRPMRSPTPTGPVLSRVMTACTSGFNSVESATNKMWHQHWLMVHHHTISIQRLGWLNVHYACVCQPSLVLRWCITWAKMHAYRNVCVCVCVHACVRACVCSCRCVVPLTSRIARLFASCPEVVFEWSQPKCISKHGRVSDLILLVAGQVVTTHSHLQTHLTGSHHSLAPTNTPDR